VEEIVKILHYKSNELTGFYNWLSKKEAADMSERKLVGTVEVHSGDIAMLIHLLYCRWKIF